jgi:hypothetical protein
MTHAQRDQSKRPYSKRRRTLLTGFGLIVALWCALTAKLFLWPAMDPMVGTHADAILMLGGPGKRLRTALSLARRHAAPVLLVSVPSLEWSCPHVSVPGVEVRCFVPDPASTQGEAQYFGREARVHGWKSVIVVSTVQQSTRARIRVKRCFPGTVKVVGVPLPPLQAAYYTVYEWGAMAKALIWQRAC